MTAGTIGRLHFNSLHPLLPCWLPGCPQIVAQGNTVFTTSDVVIASKVTGVSDRYLGACCHQLGASVTRAARRCTCELPHAASAKAFATSLSELSRSRPCWSECIR